MAIELTCFGLGKEQGKWAGPSCHLLQIAGAHLLLECPLDMAMLHFFLPAADIPLQNRQYVDTTHETHYNKIPDTNVGTSQQSSRKRQLLGFHDEDDDQICWFHLDDMHGPRAHHAPEACRTRKELGFSLAPHTSAETATALGLTRVINGHALLDVEPWYKTAEFSLLDVSSLDVVLISSPENMLGLPMLTRTENFSGKIYATSVTAKLGQLMMEELIYLHGEYVQNFGRSDSEKKPIWLDLAALNGFPPLLKKALVDDDGVGRANWQYLYKKKDIQDCMKQVQCVHYDEEISIFDCLCIKPCSSGFELGASNWVISGARHLSYFPASDLASEHSMALNIASHVHSEVFLFCDLKSNSIDDCDDAISSSGSVEDREGCGYKNFLSDQSRQGACQGHLVNQLAEVSKAVLETVHSGGSVLVLMSGIGALLEALEVISQTLDCSNLGDVPLFFISPVAEELLVYTNTVPEWLSAARQEKLYAGEALFGHVELLQQKRLHQLSALHSGETVKVWREPCVAFALNWGLRMGPAVHLIQRWRQNPHCLLILPQTGMNAKLALAPFQPLRMKILLYNRNGKLGEAEVSAIIEKLKPVLSLVPETMRRDFQPLPDVDSGGSRGDIAFYNMWDILTIPAPQHIEVDMMAEVACMVHPKQLDSGIAVGKVKTSVQQKGGKWLLEIPNFSEGPEAGLTAEDIICWGAVQVNELVDILQERGLCCEVHSQEQENVCEYCIVIMAPSLARVELRPHCTLIETDDPVLRNVITDAVKSFLTVV